MSADLLLTTDEVSLTYPSVDTDEHGWRLPTEAPVVWTGLGNLQLQPGISSPRAAEQGGRGPYGPARDAYGQLYLPADAPVVEGAQVSVRGRTYVLSQTRVVADPRGEELECWVATVTSVDTWPA